MQMKQSLPLSEQLNILFEVRLHPDGRPFKLSEVSQAAGLSHGSLSQMRTGKESNPQLATLRALCDFFDVPLRYFETQTRDECYDLLATMPAATTPQMNEIAFRALRLTPQAQHDILTLIRWVEAAEELRKHGHNLPPLPHLGHETGE